MPVPIAQDLHLDVRGDGRYRSRNTRSSPKAAPASRRADATASCSASASRTIRMPRPPPPPAALIKHRHADRRRGPRHPIRRSPVELLARKRGHSGPRDEALGLDLVAHRGNGFRRRTNPGEASLDHRPREARILRQKPVPRMDGVGPDPLRRRDELSRRRGRSPPRTGPRAPPPRPPPARAAHRDPDPHRPRPSQSPSARQSERCGGQSPPDWPPATDGWASVPRQSRKTPKRSVPRTSAPCTADSAMPSTVRVSRGSMMPSSATRARRVERERLPLRAILDGREEPRVLLLVERPAPPPARRRGARSTSRRRAASGP